MLYFDYNSNNKINTGSKWNINQFVNTSKKKQTYVITGDLDPKDAQELERIIRAMDLEYNKVTAELNKASQDLQLMSSLLKKRIDNFSTSGEPGEVEIQYRKMDMDLTIAKSRISSDKIKLYESKLKQVRDERKLMYDRNKALGGADVTSSVQSSNPLIATASLAASAGSTPGGYSIPSDLVNLLKTQLVNKAEEPQIERLGSKEPEPVEIKPVMSTPYVGEEKVISNNNSLGIITEDTVTLKDQYDKNNSIIAEREKNKEKIFANQEGFLDAKYSRALDSLINNSLNIIEVLTVDKNTGKYWVEGFVENENGERELCKTYQPKSINHIGSLRFDVKNSKVKTTHYDEPMEFKVGDETNMTPFYKKEWSQASTQRFILEPTVTELI